MPRYMDFQRR